MEATPVKSPGKTAKRKGAVSPPKPSPSLKMYRRIALTFVVATFLTLATVVYLSFSRATIHIVSESQAIESDFIADVVALPAANTDIAGKLVENTFEQASEMVLTGEGSKQVEAKAGGMVTIYNKTAKAQPLVATTRLLSPQGVLFRIDTGVTVPAQGKVQVMAHADEPGVAGEIAPTTFTIPGLAASLQSSIYAQSAETFVGGLQKVRVVTEADLEVAAEALEAQMVDAAKETLRLQAGGSYSGEVFLSDVLEKKSDTPPGTESGTVTVSLKLQVVGVFYQAADLAALAQAKLNEEVPKGMELQFVDQDSMQVTIAEEDVEEQIANLHVTLSGEAMLSPTSGLLDKGQFVGRSAVEVKTALESSEAIKSVEITFTPFWLKRLPTLKDHIKIVIE